MSCFLNTHGRPVFPKKKQRRNGLGDENRGGDRLRDSEERREGKLWQAYKINK